jgi:hypothetical protein
MPTLRADIDAVAMDIHRHEVVDLNTIRAADDHRLSPQAGVPIFCAMLHPSLLSQSEDFYSEVHRDGFLAIYHFFAFRQDVVPHGQVDFKRIDMRIREVLVFHQDEDGC